MTERLAAELAVSLQLAWELLQRVCVLWALAE